MRRRVGWYVGSSAAALLLAAIAVPLAAAPSADAEPQDAPSPRASSPAPPPTDAESYEIQLRAQFGLRSDLPYVRTVDADRSSNTDRLGIPLTPDEAADITARSATVGALHTAAQDLDGFGGIWIDQAAGGVIHLAMAGTWSEETIQRLRSLVPAGREFVLTPVAVSLADLDSLLARLADVVVSDPSIRPHVAILEREEHLNTVRLTMLTDTPQETLDRIAQEFGGPGFVLDTAAEGGYRYD
ncbi:hypothetical protein [Blastococcus goldschmidtiae]|uniref:Uncharacterized protein n=1 Tax=Blastococcus goldschmidtiae TaxID=3075546 RepID=A0ABU2K740_9ACTN|nr:hypothetical protein [Blastococcus sp. DSM 46792]MDT0276010.1 hypothetical protein [Blastococcus sp. DSM 46792]